MQPEQPTSPTPSPVIVDPNSSIAPPPGKREGLRAILSTVTILVTALAVAFFLTAFVFQSYQVDGQSMETTLQNNDRLIVWKMPRTWARLTRHDYIPKRGDVVIFVGRMLGEFGQDPNKQLVKRVMGLPGDRVVVKNGVLTIYNSGHPKGFRPDDSLPYGKVITETDHDGEWTIKSGQVFVCGDNRTNSLDSRLFGPINTKDIVGKLIVRVLPFNHLEKF